MAAQADKLYTVNGGRLYEISTTDGSRLAVGKDLWEDATAMVAMGGQLYLVSGNQLYEVNPQTGSRRSVGKADWSRTTSILTVGDKLYIVANQRIHRVNPRNGSYEVLQFKTDGTKNPLSIRTIASGGASEECRFSAIELWHKAINLVVTFCAWKPSHLQLCCRRA